MERCFIHYNRAWYSRSPNQPNHSWEDEVSFSVIDDEAVHEFHIRWYQISVYDISAKFECFDDTWVALDQIKDVLEAMRLEEAANTSPMDFCNLLMLLGFVDNTQEEDLTVKV